MCLMSSNYAVAKVSYGFRAALWDARSSALTRRIKSSVASCWLSRRFASALIFWFKSSSAAATRDSRGKAMSISFATIGDLRQHRSAFYCTVPVLGLPSVVQSLRDPYLFLYAVQTVGCFFDPMSVRLANLVW